MILAGKTYRVIFTDGRTVEAAVSLSDELRFEQSQKTSLNRELNHADGVPLWVVAGIIHWRLLRSAEDIPQDLDEFIDLLDPDEWLEVLDEGKAEVSDPAPPTGPSPLSAGGSESHPET